jgi:hypothetical protein
VVRSKVISGAALVLLLAAGGGGAYAAHRYGPILISDAARVELGMAGECVERSYSGRPACYREALTAQVAQSGVAGAIAALRALARTDPSVDHEGHVYAHGIGIEGYLHAKSVPATFEHCPAEFASGCGHGVIQAYLESQTAVDSATINALCEPYHAPGRTQWQLFQCVHGMGHGLNMMYQGDLPRALSTCDLLGQGWDRASCYGGAFMENIMSEISPHHPASELTAEGHEVGHEGHETFKRLDRSQPLYPCSIMAQKYLPQCYEIHTAAILHFTRGSIPKTAAICDTAPADMRPVCYQSLGRDITAKARRRPERVRSYCDQGSEQYRSWCYYGAAKSLIDWGARAEDGIAFCRIVGTARGALLCFRAVGEQLRALGGAEPERERLCATAGGAEAVEACRFSAALPGSKPPRDDS